MTFDELIKKELQYITNNLEFSPKCPDDIKDYLLDEYLADEDLETGLIFTTYEGELVSGTTKEELREKYGEDDETVEDYAESEGELNDEDDWF